LARKKPTVDFDGGPMRKESRGDKTQLELFLASVRGWEAFSRRRLDDGKPFKYAT
jgi:hypothetical protein